MLLYLDEKLWGALGGIHKLRGQIISTFWPYTYVRGQILYYERGQNQHFSDHVCMSSCPHSLWIVPHQDNVGITSEIFEIFKKVLLKAPTINQH